ncbi:MAG TPA: DUF2800 domain-containing protein [Alphaproteobacteria bacterium]|nr:DUF2800 domain-containing protein [Alphaproteobacteria bacterium]
MTRRLRPSSAERWINCPGSVRESEGMPNESSVYAMEGTAAHRLAEVCLTNQSDAGEFEGWRIFVKNSVAQLAEPSANACPDGHHEFAVTSEMVEAVQFYLDTVRDFVEKGDDLHVEQFVEVPEIPDYGGTADAIVVKNAARRLVVADLKYGRGVVVDAEGNPQALTYADGALRRFHNYDIAEVWVVIIQPRAEGNPVKTYKIDVLDLWDWKGELISAAKRTEAPDAPLVPGDWCKFCPAAPKCVALEQRVTSEIMADFSDTGDIILSDPPSINPERIARILDNGGIIENWLARVRDYAHSLVESGKTIPGWKLVPKRAFREWTDEGDVPQNLSVMLGLTDDQIFERKLKSPAKIESTIGKKRKGEIAHLWESVSSGTTLAPEADRRQEIQTDPSSDFA